MSLLRSSVRRLSAPLAITRPSTIAATALFSSSAHPTTSRRTSSPRPQHSPNHRPSPLRRPYSSSSAAPNPTPTPDTPSTSTQTSTPQPPDYLDPAELHIFTLISSALAPTQLEVQDISGGCGSMYALDIVSEKFRGLSTIKQHRLVNGILGEEIKKWHGVQMKTRAP